MSQPYVHTNTESPWLDPGRYLGCLCPPPRAGRGSAAPGRPPGPGARTSAPSPRRLCCCPLAAGPSPSRASATLGRGRDTRTNGNEGRLRDEGEDEGIDWLLIIVCTRLGQWVRVLIAVGINWDTNSAQIRAVWSFPTRGQQSLTHCMTPKYSFCCISDKWRYLIYEY